MIGGKSLRKRGQKIEKKRKPGRKAKVTINASKGRTKFIKKEREKDRSIEIERDFLFLYLIFFLPSATFQTILKHFVRRELLQTIIN